MPHPVMGHDMAGSVGTIPLRWVHSMVLLGRAIAEWVSVVVIVKLLLLLLVVVVAMVVVLLLVVVGGGLMVVVVGGGLMVVVVVDLMVVGGGLMLVGIVVVGGLMVVVTVVLVVLLMGWHVVVVHHAPGIVQTLWPALMLHVMVRGHGVPALHAGLITRHEPRAAHVLVLPIVIGPWSIIMGLSSIDAEILHVIARGSSIVVQLHITWRESRANPDRAPAGVHPPTLCVPPEVWSMTRAPLALTRNSRRGAHDVGYRPTAIRCAGTPALGKGTVRPLLVPSLLSSPRGTHYAPSVVLPRTHSATSHETLDHGLCSMGGVHKLTLPRRQRTMPGLQTCLTGEALLTRQRYMGTVKESLHGLPSALHPPFPLHPRHVPPLHILHNPLPPPATAPRPSTALFAPRP